ncbi:PREDICTED: GDSL esterase/lipase EXL3-like isoform X2 [Nelumbo nucifera]|uniref:GDSL esterase/lipase EXL3-like isoform X2 n=1 Tax=Nelumbo nucifera TaxID=4432 RepID=A0A1U8AJB0_NELNU|nr:PREDICTED: GDSL esterase/lipase EXL3-like isoform X2 [Nelumbo nucifera]
MQQLAALELGLVSPTTCCLVILLSIFSCFDLQIIQAAGFILPENVSFPALFMFGDSIVDTGNNNYIVSIAKCNFAPYGRDFPEGKPTGRFSNGKVPSDLIAEALGVKELLPPYLDPTLQIEDLLTGVNFASGGAAFDIIAPEVLSAFTMSDQLEMFKQYIEKLKAVVGEEKTATILAESAYIICAGSNDLAGYFITPTRKMDYDAPSYTHLMVQMATSFIRELHQLGARNIGVINAPPVGCVPFQRTVNGGKVKGCAENYNAAAKMFNAKLQPQIHWLKKELPHTRLVYIDVYYPLLDIIQRPHLYGFEESTKGCCGTGSIELSILCNDLNPCTCEDASKYVFWDSYHPTEKAYAILVDILIKEFTKSFV